MENKIKCKHCNVEYGIKNFARHLKAKHGIVYSDYIEENLEEFHQFGWNRCPYTGKIVKGKCDPKYTARYIGDIQRGIPTGPFTEEHKRKLSESKKGEKHPFWGKKRDFMTDEIRAKIGKANKEVYSKQQHPWAGRKHSVECKQKMSEIKKEYYKKHDVPFKGKTHSVESIKKIFKRKPMNGLEKLVYDRLNELGIKHHFQFFITEGDVCRIFDFKIKGKNAIIETDGDFWHGNPNTKHHCKEINEVRINDKFKDEMAARRGYKVYRLWESDIKKDITVVDSVINEIFKQ
jgi:very-short-patch-repair endonuclease